MWSFISISIVGDIEKHHYLISIDSIQKDPLYHKFSSAEGDEQVNSTMMLINSAPHLVHAALFEEFTEVCPKYFQIYFKLGKDDNYSLSYHNLDTLGTYLAEPTIRYIFIRVNLDGANSSSHVNCVIIDSLRSYIGSK